MRNRLLFKFILAYIALFAAGFLLLSTLGSHLIEKRLIAFSSRDLYDEASEIAENIDLSSHPDSDSLADFHKNLAALSDYQNSRIWLISPAGEIYVNSEEAVSTDGFRQIDGFDPLKLGTDYYTIGNFFGQFDSDQLTVMLPIRQGLTLTGYLAILQDMSVIYTRRESILAIVHLICLILFCLFLSIFLLLFFFVLRPLKQITKGAEKFSSGDLTYRIPLKSSDEFGLLASSLNYMADRLNASGEFQKKFIANVSHDFRSPLTSIKGYLEAIQDGTIPPELQSHYLDIVLGETDRLTKLTNGILTLNTLDRREYQLNMTDFDVNEMLRSGASVFEGRCTVRRISIHLILTGQTLMVHADYEKIQQVLYNLLDNAIKFSKDHSTIELESSLKKDKVYISVRDHGVGIPQDAIGKIWTRFYKQDQSRGKERKGNGLGLSIVKEIMNAHHQSITVVSTPGIGTEFVFSLQSADGAEAAPADLP